MLTLDPTWTPLDTTYPNLVTSYTIDRGRQYELDRTDVGRATVSIIDRDGLLDPTNASGPYWNKIAPLIQAVIRRYNPTDDTWETRYRGFVEDIDYTFDPSAKFNRLELSLVDMFEILSIIEMTPGEFGDGVSSDGQVWYDVENVDERIKHILTNAIGATARADFARVFEGNVKCFDQTYSPGESAMTGIYEACDAEFPTVANVYTDREGILSFHGRNAKFDPEDTAFDTDWEFHNWAVADGVNVYAAPGEAAQLREFSFNYGLAYVINSALATPKDVADADIAGQLSQDPTSIGLRGVRSWSAQSLLTLSNKLGTSTALEETKRFSDYFVANYATPQKRITGITIKSMTPDTVGAGITWDLLSRIDIGDRVYVTIGSPGGGGFEAEQYLVEGIHEQVQPLDAPYDAVTMQLDLSPKTYYPTDGFPS